MLFVNTAIWVLMMIIRYAIAIDQKTDYMIWALKYTYRNILRQDKYRHLADTIFIFIHFFYENWWTFELKFNWNSFPMVQLAIDHDCFR